MRVLGLLFVALLVLSSHAPGQARFAGKVVEVIDGRTMVVETGAGRVTTQLQYIETPEPEQPLYKTVRDHLTNLALGKVVEFRPLRLHDKLTVGRVEMGGIDIGLQLLRDGAAWHEPSETSGQPANEANEYASNQASAKVEKRGVWSVPNLKTPWEVRAEKQAELDRLDKERRSTRPTVVGVNQFQTVNRPGPAPDYWANRGDKGQLDLWADLFAQKGKEGYGLHTYSDSQDRFDVIYTSTNFLNMTLGEENFRLECRLTYYLSKVPNPLGQEWYALYFRSISENYQFSRRPSALTIVADKRRFSVGRPYAGARGNVSYGSHELFFYRLSRAQVAAIAKARSVEIRIDAAAGSLDEDTLRLFRDLGDTMK